MNNTNDIEVGELEIRGVFTSLLRSFAIEFNVNNPPDNEHDHWYISKDENGELTAAYSSSAIGDIPYFNSHKGVDEAIKYFGTHDFDMYYFKNEGDRA